MAAEAPTETLPKTREALPKTREALPRATVALLRAKPILPRVAETLQRARETVVRLVPEAILAGATETRARGATVLEREAAVGLVPKHGVVPVVTLALGIVPAISKLERKRWRVLPAAAVLERAMQRFDSFQHPPFAQSSKSWQQPVLVEGTHTHTKNT